ncbi:MAG: maleylpyruvate isomerase family mycothiol-dependent enzyme [Nocardioidaceae bacterium]
MTTAATLPKIDETLLATTRYLEALTHLDDQSVQRSSLLPGWSRAHVVAHLSRNADAFTAVLAAAASGAPASMYSSNEARDREIAETVQRLDLSALVEDAIGSVARLTDTFWAFDGDPDTTYGRVPGDPVSSPLHTIGPRRRAEVEIHHADLGLGYRPAEWPVDFSSAMVKQRHEELAALDGGCPAMVVEPTDVDGRWTFGEGPGPEIRGTAGDLAWWLVGRGGGQGLTCSAGELPVLGRWR